MICLVTGTSGYIGRAISSHLVEQGHRVLEIPGRKDFSSLLDEALKLSPPDVVIHAGCTTEFIEARDGETSNVTNTRILVEKLGQLQNKPYVILTGAAGIFGVSPKPTDLDENSSGSTSGKYLPYDRTQYIQDKRSQMRLLEHYSGPHVTLALTTVFGRKMPARTLGFYRDLRKKPFTVSPPGGTSFLGENDMLSAIDTCLAKRPVGCYIVTSGNITFPEIFALASSSRVFTLPRFAIYPFMIAHVFLKRFHVLISTFGYKYYSGKKFELETGWRPSEKLPDIFNAIL